MSVDLYDMAERAESLVRQTNFQGMSQDEIIGLFYQEFCKPTKIEEQYKAKCKWMLENGFKKKKHNGVQVLVYNNDFYWSKEDIMYFTLSEIKHQVEVYNKKYITK